MSSYGCLRVGSLVISSLRNSVDDELLALFRDDMLEIIKSTANQYYTALNGYVEPDNQDDREIEIVRYRAVGSMIADRLDMLGATEKSALRFLNEQLATNDEIRRLPGVSLDGFEWPSAEARTRHEVTQRLRTSLDASRWLELLSSAKAGPFWEHSPEPGSRLWLLGELRYSNYLDERQVLRAVLMAIPDCEVVLDITDLINAGYMDVSDPMSMASKAGQGIKASAGISAPVVVITEGRTDAEFLKAALDILFPHLNDLIRFLDYDQKPEGGVGALISMVRAFSAAGIINRVIAIFDNDTAAVDGIRKLDMRSLPEHFSVIKYPAIELANNYPTLGPPTADAPDGELSIANVNGLAGSIELYLGKDVLSGEDGSLLPVQWKSFIAGVGKYQGEVINKGDVHRAFRDKYSRALSDREIVQRQDWHGLSLILNAIRHAVQG